MRGRILRSSLAVAFVAVLLIGVPGAIAASVVARQDAERAAVQVAGQVESGVAARLHARAPVTDEVLAGVPPGHYVEVRLPNGGVLTTGDRPGGAAFVVNHDMAGTMVTVVRSRSAAYGGMLRNASLVLLFAAAAAVLAAVSLGLRQARKLSEPLVDLALRARRLGSGDARASFKRYGVEEVDRVAEALERSAERVADTLAREQQFASEASHQLRTPLTALSMRLEEMILQADDPETVREEARFALGQVERLATTVDHLLAVRRQPTSATTVPLLVDEVVAQQVEEWSPSFAAVGRRIRVTGRRGMWACATPGGVSQVLATLLENGLKHGGGTVTIRARRRGDRAVLEVSDEGLGVPGELGSRVFERSVSGRSSTGLGLALARDLAEADGGRLELVEQRPAVFALFLGVPGADKEQAARAAGKEQPAAVERRSPAAAGEPTITA